MSPMCTHGTESDRGEGMTTPATAPGAATEYTLARWVYRICVLEYFGKYFGGEFEDGGVLSIGVL